MIIWRTSKPTTDKMLRGMVAAEYMCQEGFTDPGEEKQYWRTEKQIGKGSSKDVLWFIRRYRGPTTTDIKRFMMLESQEWESIRTSLLEEGMITKEHGVWWLV